MARLTRPAWIIASAALIAGAFGASPNARSQDVADQYVLTSDVRYSMLPGPEGVTWCAGQVVSEGHPFVSWSLEQLQAIRLASLSEPGSDTPALQVLLPTIDQLVNFTLALGPGGRLYYADTSAPAPRGDPEPWTYIRVWAYLTPAEFGALLADPSRCVVVRAQDVTRFEELYQRLTAEPMVWIARKRAPQLLEEVTQLHRPLLGPPNPNEPWTNPEPDPEGFTARLLQLVNQIIGDEHHAVSLYQRDRYADRQLPIQIIEVMRRIYELGGAYDGSQAAGARGGGPPPDDPWSRFRPPPKPNQPSAPAGPRSSPEITRQVRLLNRLLLEYDLDGLLQGTMYRWIKDLPTYRPCDSHTDPGRLIKGARVLSDLEDLYDLMPMRIEPNGAVALLLEPRSAEADGVEPAYYVVGPGGELAGPQPEVPGDALHTTSGTDVLAAYTVRGRDVRWVTVEQGQPAAGGGY